MGKVCRVCGYEGEEGFCPICGLSLSEELKSTGTPIIKENYKSEKMPIIKIIGLIILILGLLGLIFMTGTGILIFLVILFFVVVFAELGGLNGLIELITLPVALFGGWVEDYIPDLESVSSDLIWVLRVFGGLPFYITPLLVSIIGFCIFKFCGNRKNG